MVVLKTPSQVNSFVKRMEKEHEDYHDEGCGCCGYSTYVLRTRNRIILEYNHMQQGYEQRSVQVLAVLKGRAR